MAVFGPVVLFVTLLGLQREANRVFQISIAVLCISILVLGTAFGINGVAVAVVIVWAYWHRQLYVTIRDNTPYRTLQLLPRDQRDDRRS